MGECNCFACAGSYDYEQAMQEYVDTYFKVYKFYYWKWYAESNHESYMSMLNNLHMTVDDYFSYIKSGYGWAGPVPDNFKKYVDEMDPEEYLRICIGADVYKGLPATP